MNSDEHGTRETTGQLDKVCDRFERAWQSGDTLEVSRFLAANADQWQP